MPRRFKWMSESQKTKDLYHRGRAPPVAHFNDQTALDIALENMNTCHPDHVPKYAEIIRMIEAHQGLRIDKAGCEVQQECISPQCF